MEEKKSQKRAVESREKLYAAAYYLFIEKGYYNTNTKEIARYAGISVGNFYNYYKDKEDIYCILAEEYMKKSNEELEKLAAHLKSAEYPREEFQNYLNAQMQRLDETGRFFEDSQMIRKDSSRLQEVFAVGTKKVQKTLEEMLHQIKGVQKRASYPVMARMLSAMVDRMMLDIMDTRGTDIYEEYLEEFMSLIIEYVFGKNTTCHSKNPNL